MKAANLQNQKRSRRVGRKFRVRKKVVGTAERPRMSVFRSNRSISVQLIDDRAGVTLASASTSAKGFKVDGSAKGADAAAELGRVIAAAAKEKKIDSVVFDKGWYKYHGRVKALADAAREAGLKL